uniref:Uncharacterized protein n=1 Tax=Anopheles albimanus TaxID=7167 RepID=A0A182FUN2_ANOAL
MIRALVPVLAYVSLLLVSSSYSLHMARDAYIKPPPPPPPPSSADAQLLDDLDSMSELLAAEENSVDLMRPLSSGVSIGGGASGGSSNVRTMLGSVHQKLAHSGGGGGGGAASNSILSSNSAVSSSSSSSSSRGSISSSSNSAVSSNSGNSNGLLPVASLTMGGSHQLRPVSSHVTSNELPELSPPPAHLPVAVLRHGPIGPLVVGPQPPRALQELFGVQTNFDIRAAQQHRPHGHQQQYADGGTAASSSSSSGSSMDDRDDDDGGDGGEEDTDTDRELQRTATGNSKRASPTNSRNKMMADSGGGGQEGGSSMPSIPHSVANQMMLRSTRGQRQYDVPQIESYRVSNLGGQLAPELDHVTETLGSRHGFPGPASNDRSA